MTSLGRRQLRRRRWEKSGTFRLSNGGGNDIQRLLGREYGLLALGAGEVRTRWNSVNCDESTAVETARTRGCHGHAAQVEIGSSRSAVNMPGAASGEREPRAIRRTISPVGLLSILPAMPDTGRSGNSAIRSMSITLLIGALPVRSCWTWLSSGSKAPRLTETGFTCLLTTTVKQSIEPTSEQVMSRYCSRCPRLLAVARSKVSRCAVLGRFARRNRSRSVIARLSAMTLSMCTSR